MNIEKVIKVINLVSNENRSAEEEKEFIDFILNCESDIYILEKMKMVMIL